MTSSPVKKVPEGMHTVTPHLVCAGAADAIDFYKKAFNAVELVRMPDPGGKLMHGSIRIGDSTIMLADEFPDDGSFGPKSLKGSPVTVHLYVEDADAFATRAIAAGAKVTMPVTDMFWGIVTDNSKIRLAIVGRSPRMFGMLRPRRCERRWARWAAKARSAPSRAREPGDRTRERSIITTRGQGENALPGTGREPGAISSCAAVATLKSCRRPTLRKNSAQVSRRLSGLTMAKEHRSTLAERVNTAAEASLAAQGYVSPIDVLLGIGWLDPGAAERWRRGQVGTLESVVQTNLPRISEAMRLFRSWAAGKQLKPSETAYVARTPRRETLRFSRSGDGTIERLYRTHWVSPELSEKKRESLAEKASRAPELVVIQPLNSAWTCHRCGGTGGLLIMENPGPACLRCAGLDDLEFLPAGDPLLTRRVKAKSPRCAVVVRFSKSRRRYERQGLLAEKQSVADVMRGLEERRRA